MLMRHGCSPTTNSIVASKPGGMSGANSPTPCSTPKAFSRHGSLQVESSTSFDHEYWRPEGARIEALRRRYRADASRQCRHPEPATGPDGRLRRRSRRSSRGGARWCRGSAMITPPCSSDRGTQQDDIEHDTGSLGVADPPMVLPGRSHLAELRRSGLIE